MQNMIIITEDIFIVLFICPALFEAFYNIHIHLEQHIISYFADEETEFRQLGEANRGQTQGLNLGRWDAEFCTKTLHYASV